MPKIAGAHDTPGAPTTANQLTLFEALLFQLDVGGEDVDLSRRDGSFSDDRCVTVVGVAMQLVGLRGHDLAGMA